MAFKYVAVLKPSEEMHLNRQLVQSGRGLSDLRKSVVPRWLILSQVAPPGFPRPGAQPFAHLRRESLETESKRRDVVVSRLLKQQVLGSQRSEVEAAGERARLLSAMLDAASGLLGGKVSVDFGTLRSSWKTSLLSDPMSDPDQG